MRASIKGYVRGTDLVRVLRGVLTGRITPPPGFFVSVASKGFSVPISGLESTLVDISISVDCKEVSGPEPVGRLLIAAWAW